MKDKTSSSFVARNHGMIQSKGSTNLNNHTSLIAKTKFTHITQTRNTESKSRLKSALPMQGGSKSSTHNDRSGGISFKDQQKLIKNVSSTITRPIASTTRHAA